MKKLAFVFFILASFQLLAQPKGDKPKKEKIEQLKIAYITKGLDLSTEESEKFWPVYNEMSKKMKENRKERMTLAKDLKDNVETLKESEIKTKIDAILKNEQAGLDIKKEYSDKIAAVIGYKKSVKLISLEKEFREELRKELQKRKGAEGEHPPHPEE